MAASQPAAPEARLTIVSLNDLHGRLGALPAFAGYVSALRASAGESVLVVDAGDLFQGTIGSNRLQGAPVIAAYNAIGVDAAALGNHEFDYGPVPGGTGSEAAGPQGALRARLAEARFPIVSANLVERATGRTPAWKNLHASVLLTRAGVRIGVAGLLTRETPNIVFADYFAGLDATELAPALEREARALRAQGAEVVIALAHAGVNCRKFDDPDDLSSCDPDDFELFDVVRALPPGLVDVLVGGHTHAGAAHRLNGSVVIEAFSRGKAFGRVDLRIGGAPRRVLEARPFAPEPLCPDSAELAPCATHAYAGLDVQPSPAIAALIEPALALARTERQRALGPVLSAELSAEHGVESPLGNLFADATRAAVPGADVAIVNGGTLRAKLPKGPLSYGSLFEAMPFDNRLVSFTLSGAELRRVLVEHLAHDDHGIVSLSGLRLSASCEGPALNVRLVRPNGRAVADTDRLLVAVSDYLAKGGDQLFRPIALDASRLDFADKRLLRDVLATEIGKLRRIDPADPKLFDPKHPRLALPSPRPVRCGP